MTPENDVLEGDCVEVMATFDADSIDSIVCDPPYDLVSVTKRFGGTNARNTPAMDTAEGGVWARKARGFMGKTWDGTGIAFDPATWAAALRAAKPGAHLLAFGGTRTYHRLAAAIEDAGWEIRDCLVWAYASGFPKSLNFPDGWGTALKPAWEPIVMARKPLWGTVAANREQHGTGALNIDETRIALAPGDAEFMESRMPAWNRKPEWEGAAAINVGPRSEKAPQGRWPANVILTDPIFDGDTLGVVGGGEQRSPEPYIRSADAEGETSWTLGRKAGHETGDYGDSGTYSRFFLIPKAARSDREPVLGGLPLREGGGHVAQQDGKRMGRTSEEGANVRPLPQRANVHPTVKPTELMRHLVRLVTPPGGLVLDPFLGSGTTALAAEMEGFRWLGIEKEPEYVAIARARLLGTQRGLGLSA